MEKLKIDTELFAQFLGWKKTEEVSEVADQDNIYITPFSVEVINEYDSLDGKAIYDNELPAYMFKFKDDWNWLMLVVEKINSTENVQLNMGHNWAEILINGMTEYEATAQKNMRSATFFVCYLYVKNHMADPIYQDDEEAWKFIDEYVHNIWVKMGINRPSNHDDIVEFCLDDIEECASPTDWHTGDIDIAFRRYLESKKNN